MHNDKGERMRVPAMALLLLAGAAWGGVPDGARLYEQHCAVCHGEAGAGGVGLPLANASLLSSVSDDYLRTTIRLGRPGRVMPPFAHLSEAEVEAVIGYVRGFSPVPVRSFPSETVQGDAVRGARLYAQHCAACHGERGQGGRGTGVTFSRPRELPILAPALNNPGFLAAASDAMIKYTLMTGREGTPMPSFLRRGLTEQDIDDIVAYVRSFQAQPVRAAPGADAPLQPVLVADSPYDLEQSLENLKQAVIGKNFRIIRQQYLEDGLFPEQRQNRRQVILYFCNFAFLNEALKIDPRVGMFLPCRVTLVEREDGSVQLMTINPLRLSKLFNNDELDQACKEMYGIYRDLLEEATL